MFIFLGIAAVTLIFFMWVAHDLYKTIAVSLSLQIGLVAGIIWMLLGYTLKGSLYVGIIAAIATVIISWLAQKILGFRLPRVRFRLTFGIPRLVAKIRNTRNRKQSTGKTGLAAAHLRAPSWEEMSRDEKLKMFERQLLGIMLLKGERARHYYDPDVLLRFIESDRVQAEFGLFAQAVLNILKLATVDQQTFLNCFALMERSNRSGFVNFEVTPTLLDAFSTLIESQVQFFIQESAETTVAHDNQSVVQDASNLKVAKEARYLLQHLTLLWIGSLAFQHFGRKPIFHFDVAISMDLPM